MLSMSPYIPWTLSFSVGQINANCRYLYYCACRHFMESQNFSLLTHMAGWGCPEINNLCEQPQPKAIESSYINTPVSSSPRRITLRPVFCTGS